MNVSAHLTRLEANDLIRLAQTQPEVTYLFRHALVQEATYHSLVKGDRRRLHRTVGETLERLAPAGAPSSDLAPLLAEHFDQAGDPARALPYYTLAGQAAADRYANGEAIQLFGRALEMAHALTSVDDQIIELCLRRGRALELNAQDAEALRNYEALESWAAARGNRRAELAALAARGTIYVKPSIEQNQALGHELSQRALSLARELGDRPAEAKVLWNLLQHHIARQQFAEALESGEQALRLAREEGLREQVAFVLTDLLKVYYTADQQDRSLAALAEARGLWRELGKLNMLADNLSTTAMVGIFSGDYERALALSAEARQVSRAIGNLWNEAYSYYMVDLVHFDRGEIGTAIETAEAGRRLSEQSGFVEGLNQGSFNLVLILDYMGDQERALEIARETQARADALAGEAHAWRALESVVAQLHLHAGRPAEAQAVLDAASIGPNLSGTRPQFSTEALFIGAVSAEMALARGDAELALDLAETVVRVLRKSGTRLFVTDALILQGQALLAAGRRAEAKAALRMAQAEAEALGSRRARWQILAELARLAEADGAQTEAAVLWRQAGELVDYIAAHAGSAELADSFRGRAEVREVLEKTTGSP